MAAEWVEREIEKFAGVTPKIATGGAGIASGDSNTQLVFATYSRETKNLKQVVGLLDEADRAVLSDPKRSEQGYVIRSGNNRMAVVGGSAQGTLYGAVTVLQLLQVDRGNVSIPRVHVRDWPDFRYRIAESPTFGEGRNNFDRGWCYDWGDGVDNYRERLKGIFDRCLRYKINMMCFTSGFDDPFSKMWDGDEFPLQKDLNRLAAERGVKLLIGGYGVGSNDPTMRNRRSYPAGEAYSCFFDPNLGNCRSNDALTKRIQDRIHDYVRKTEPRALYIHHEDIWDYATAHAYWKQRCDQCKKRWPSDEMAAADGAAGGFMHGYNAICDAIFSVKNADSGYDASRDCLVLLVSPGYTSSDESDAEWDKQLAYWKFASKLLKYKKNVCTCIREQFLRNDNNHKRVLEMANAIRNEGGGPGLFTFSISRTSLWCLGPLFLTRPRGNEQTQ